MNVDAFVCFSRKIPISPVNPDGANSDDINKKTKIKDVIARCFYIDNKMEEIREAIGKISLNVFASNLVLKILQIA